MTDPKTYGEIVAEDYEAHGNPFEWIDGEPPVKATAAKRVPVKPVAKKVCRPTGIRCGSCQGRHATVADVRACYGN